MIENQNRFFVTFIDVKDLSRIVKKYIPNNAENTTRKLQAAYEKQIAGEGEQH